MPRIFKEVSISYLLISDCRPFHGPFHDQMRKLHCSRAYAFGREIVCSQKSVRNRNFFENAGHVSFSFCQTGFQQKRTQNHAKPAHRVRGREMVCSQKSVRNRNFFENAEPAHRVAYAFGREMVCSQKSVRNRNFSENVGHVSFSFCQTGFQQKRTQNHAKPAHRVRQSSGQPFTGTTWSAGVGGVGLALLAILVVLAKKMVLRRIPIYFLSIIFHILKPKLASLFCRVAYAFGREMICSQKSVRNRNFLPREMVCSQKSVRNRNFLPREMVCSQKSVRNRNFFENAGHVSFSFVKLVSAETHTKPCKTSPQGTWS